MFRFLDLPLELRLQIYNHVLSNEDHAVTFSVARLEGTDSERADRLYNKRSRHLLGLPVQHIPVIRPYYDASLLYREPAVVQATSPIGPAEQGRCGYTAYPAVLLLNRQVRAEVQHHFPSAEDQRVDVFISYPHGLHVFDTYGYHLLKKARTIRICGDHIPTESNELYGQWKPSTVASCGLPLSRVDYGKKLSSLLSYVLGVTPQPTQLQMRIMYATRNAYPAIWCHDNSPIAVALSSICAMDISIEVCRGHDATGIILTARPNAEGRRNVRTVWEEIPLEFTAHSVREVSQSWVVDKRWPEFHWNERAIPSPIDELPGHADDERSFADDDDDHRPLTESEDELEDDDDEVDDWPSPVQEGIRQYLQTRVGSLIHSGRTAV